MYWFGGPCATDASRYGVVVFVVWFLVELFTTDFRSFETKDSVLSLFEKTQRVFDVRKDSQFIEPRAKTNENRHLPKRSHVFVANSFSSIFRKDSARLK